MELTLSNGFALPDPLVIEKWSENMSKTPDVTYSDICSYLIDTPSEFTKEKLKCIKSLEAYNFTFVKSKVGLYIYVTFLLPPNKALVVELFF